MRARSRRKPARRFSVARRFRAARARDRVPADARRMQSAARCVRTLRPADRPPRFRPRAERLSDRRRAAPPTRARSRSGSSPARAASRSSRRLPPCPRDRGRWSARRARSPTGAAPAPTRSRAAASRRPTATSDRDARSRAARRLPERAGFAGPSRRGPSQPVPSRRPLRARRWSRTAATRNPGTPCRPSARRRRREELPATRPRFVSRRENPRPRTPARSDSGISRASISPRPTRPSRRSSRPRPG